MSGLGFIDTNGEVIPINQYRKLSYEHLINFTTTVDNFYDKIIALVVVKLPPEYIAPITKSREDLLPTGISNGRANLNSVNYIHDHTIMRATIDFDKQIKLCAHDVCGTIAYTDTYNQLSPTELFTNFDINSRVRVDSSIPGFYKYTSDNVLFKNSITG